ncbi:MAG: 30S ribosomal protein S13 [Candidatus Woesearchaeota archaeon]|jgi:small subunit ribosomal protein S13
MEQEQKIKYLVRIANTDLIGTKPIASGLLNIRGVGFNYANMTCHLAKVNPVKKAGELTDKEIALIESIITEPAKHEVPTWMLNRQKDYESGQDMHILGPTIKFVQDNDVRRLKKIKAYKGMRHAAGLPVRGQRTRSNFRRNKGKTVGVVKSAVAKAAAASSDDKKKK